MLFLQTDVFIQNEINGPILLEIGLDDLDYMEVRKLAHRKLILKGIQDLKKNGRPTLNLMSNDASITTQSSSDISSPRLGQSININSEVNNSRPPMPPLAKDTITASSSSSSSSSTATTSVDGNCIGEVKSASSLSSANKIHWSQAKPISENVVKNDGGSQFVNLADGEYDEAAQAREFQAAVAAWRNGGSNATSAGDDNRCSTSSKNAVGLAEFGFGPESESPRNKSEWKNPWAASDSPSESSSSNAGTHVYSHKPPSLLEGEYDEAAQAREFQAAVAAWRNGGSNATSTTTSLASSDRAHAEGTVVMEVGESTGMNRLKAAEEVAAALGRQLDEQLKKETESLARQRKGIPVCVYTADTQKKGDGKTEKKRKAQYKSVSNFHMCTLTYKSHVHICVMCFIIIYSFVYVI
jgi:hypothetical protein